MVLQNEDEVSQWDFTVKKEQESNLTPQLLLQAHS